MTAKFREFYVPPGAGSNFLAGKCLWANNTDNARILDGDNNPLVNEFSFWKEQINVIDISGAREKLHRKACNAWQMFKEYKYDDDLIYESKRILPTLMELREFVYEVGDNKDDILKNDIGYIDKVIAEVKNNDFWKVDWSPCTCYLWEYNGSNLVTDSRADVLVQEAQDYFAKCREYYFKVCKKNNWNSFIISHQHPHISLSSQLKLPTTFKSLAMEIDADMDVYIIYLVSVKHIYSTKRLDGKEWFKNRKIYKELHGKIEDLYVNRNCKLSDDSVSYRKIFFENDSDEIRKMYEFFDNEDYFDENKTNILQEFQKYHNDNMAVLKQYAPDVFEEIFKRKAR